jgi:LysM repeat protein
VLANRQTDPFVTVETYPEPSRDGRINADSSDVAVYCRDGGVDVWNVYDGVGQYALYASQTQISQGLVSAISSGQNVPIASGAGGTGLWALASNELQVTLRDPSRPEYNFIMLPDRCGEVNYSAQPISQPAAALSEVSAAAPVTAAACGSPYIVQRGDTLYRISRRCGVAVATILALNNLVNPDHIEPGQVITLP